MTTPAHFQQKGRTQSEAAIIKKKFPPRKPPAPLGISTSSSLLTSIPPKPNPNRTPPELPPPRQLSSSEPPEKGASSPAMSPKNSRTMSPKNSRTMSPKNTRATPPRPGGPPNSNATTTTTTTTTTTRKRTPPRLPPRQNSFQHQLSLDGSSDRLDCGGSPSVTASSSSSSPATGAIGGMSLVIPIDQTKALKRKTIRLGNDQVIESENFAEVHCRIRRESVTLQKNEEQSKKEKTRHNCVRELYSTETDYVVDLATICSRIIVPLRSLNIITMEEMGSLFSNIEILLSYMQSLHQEMSEAMKSGEIDNIIGNLFLRHAEALMQCYTIYCVNYDEATTLLVRLLKKKNEFRKWHEKVLQDPYLHGQNLSSYLVKPVQRLCRYPLLLREIIKNTPEHHQDYKNLVAALSEVEKCVKSVDANSASKTNIKNLQRIEKLLIGDRIRLTVAGRKFIMEGRLKRVAQNGKYLERHYFLFNDLMVCTEVAGKKYKIKHYIPLSGCDVRREDEHKFGFIIQQGNKETSTILCSTEKERVLWLTSLESLVGDQPKEIVEVESGVAYAITGEDVTEEQMKMVGVMERIEGFGGKMGSSFQQRNMMELEMENRDGKDRVLILFEDVVVVAKQREGKGTKQKPLVFEQKMDLNTLDVLISHPKTKDEQQISTSESPTTTPTLTSAPTPVPTPTQTPTHLTDEQIGGPKPGMCPPVDMRLVMQELQIKRGTAPTNSPSPSSPLRERTATTATTTTAISPPPAPSRERTATTTATKESTITENVPGSPKIRSKKEPRSNPKKGSNKKTPNPMYRQHSHTFGHRNISTESVSSSSQNHQTNLAPVCVLALKNSEMSFSGEVDSNVAQQFRTLFLQQREKVLLVSTNLTPSKKKK